MRGRLALIADKSKLLSWVLFIAWLAMTAIAFWWFQFRYLSQFDAHYAAFDGNALSKVTIATQAQKPLVVHFVDEKCACARFAEPHIAELEEQFGAQLEFVRWSRNDMRLQALKGVGIPASPAVAIWNKEGELAYFGPYSSGFFCGEGEDFVHVTINKLDLGENPRWINHDVLGCFCPWSEQI